MKYELVHDESYKGRDISIYTHEDGTCTVDVKKPCGELLYGWAFISDFNHGRVKAIEFIDKMEAFNHLENNVNYCINDDDSLVPLGDNLVVPFV
jgi:hypothetical protein